MNTNEKNVQNNEEATNVAAEGSVTVGTNSETSTATDGNVSVPAAGSEGQAEATAAASPTTEVTDVPAEVAVATYTVQVTGKLTVTGSAAAGSTVRSAIKAGGGTGYENFKYQDDKGKPVALDRKLSENLKLTAIAKASGG